MKNDDIKRFMVLTGLSVLMIASVFIMNIFDSGFYRNLKTDSIITSCVYSEINSMRGSHYWIDMRLSEDETNTVINIHKTDSEISDENVQHYTVSNEVLKVTSQIINLYNMNTWNKLSSGDFEEEFSASSLLVRYSDGSSLYISDQNLSDVQKEYFSEIKKEILKFTVNSNSGLSLEKKNSYTAYSPENIMYLRAEFLENGYITVYVTNHTGNPVEYTTSFTLEKSEKGTWHELERLSDYKTEEPSDVLINDMQVLPQTLDLNAFGKLERGVYRLTMCDELVTEFTLK